MSLAAESLAPLPAGPVWLTLPLGSLLLVTFLAALWLPGSGDRFTATAQTITGFLLLIAGMVAWKLQTDIAFVDILLYGAAQMWILAFWTLRTSPGGEDDGGGGGGSKGPDEPEPPWWPEFEREFRDHVRDGGPRVGAGT